LPITDEAWQPSALAWAEQLGRYSGLTALQFIDDLTGKMLLRQKLTNKP
jgi:predicted AAA+ superfamily ATPase